MKFGPMPWILWGPGVPFGEQRRVGRLDGDDLRAGDALLEHLADAGDRAARADAGDEVVDLAVGVADDLLGRGLAVDRAGSPRSRTAAARTAPGISATISSALATAPFMPPAGSVSTSSAP